MDARQAILHIAREIMADIRDFNDICFIGMNKNGKYMAEQVALHILRMENISIEVYTKEECALAQKSKAILMLDTLCSGRSTCFALSKLLKEGGFSEIMLAVLVDCYNRRSVPLVSDFFGYRVYLAKNATVCMNLSESEEIQKTEEELGRQ